MNLSEAGALGDPTSRVSSSPAPSPTKPVGTCHQLQATRPANVNRPAGSGRSGATGINPARQDRLQIFGGLGLPEVSPNNLEIRCDVGIVPLEVPPDREQVRRFAQSLNQCQVDISAFGRHYRQKCVLGLKIEFWRVNETASLI
jgi:hypothetical protein